MFNPCKELHALKPIERLARLATKRKRCQHIIHSLFAPQSIPLCKNVIHQTRTVNFADAANRNLFTENIVDLNSRFPQSIIFCNGAVLYILMQMVPGKKILCKRSASRTGRVPNALIPRVIDCLIS